MKCRHSADAVFQATVRATATQPRSYSIFGPSPRSTSATTQHVLLDAVRRGNTLAIWDQLFGTFLYRPGIAPERLGVANPDEYPESNELSRVLALPFGRTPVVTENQKLL